LNESNCELLEVKKSDLDPYDSGSNHILLEDLSFNSNDQY
ncbi:9111_t:CDS:1, partial [Scutellospora calospora]